MSVQLPFDLLLATQNTGKVSEISDALTELPIRILTLNAVDPNPAMPDETGETFAENALLKARHCFQTYRYPTVADDSGILVEALTGELGVHTRRWGAGPDASDEQWITYFLQKMSTQQNKRAWFSCVLAYIDDAGREYTFEGHCPGTITDTLEADYLPGLPISACFRPEGHTAVFSALTVEQKNQISHRGRAIAALCNHFRASMDV